MNAIDKELLPCPFCGGNEIDIHEKYMPPSMNRSPEIISVEVRHFCPKVEGQPHGMSVKQIGRDRESAIKAWNTRTPPADTVCITRQELESWKHDKDKQGCWSDGTEIKGLSARQKEWNAAIDKLLER